jgi:hypothetical protein
MPLSRKKISIQHIAFPQNTQQNDSSIALGKMPQNGMTHQNATLQNGTVKNAV